MGRRGLVARLDSSGSDIDLCRGVVDKDKLFLFVHYPLISAMIIICMPFFGHSWTTPQLSRVMPERVRLGAACRPSRLAALRQHCQVNECKATGGASLVQRKANDLTFRFFALAGCLLSFEYSQFSSTASSSFFAWPILEE